jgi:hypothetical protein
VVGKGQVVVAAAAVVTNHLFCIASYLRLLKLNYTIVLSEQKLNDKLFNRGKSRACVRACVRACKRDREQHPG